MKVCDVRNGDRRHFFSLMPIKERADMAVAPPKEKIPITLYVWLVVFFIMIAISLPASGLANYNADEALYRKLCGIAHTGE